MIKQVLIAVFLLNGLCNSLENEANEQQNKG